MDRYAVLIETPASLWGLAGVEQSVLRFPSAHAAAAYAVTILGPAYGRRGALPWYLVDVLADRAFPAPEPSAN